MSTLTVKQKKIIWLTDSIHKKKYSYTGKKDDKHLFVIYNMKLNIPRIIKQHEFA